MNVSIEKIEAILLKRKVELVKVQEIIKDLIQAEANPKKWEHVIVLNDPEGKIKGEITGWIEIRPITAEKT